MLDRNQLTSDLLTDYALGFLSPQQMSEVEAALERYPDAHDELNAYLNGLSDLVMDLEPAAVPEGAADRLLARLNAEVSALNAPEPHAQPTAPQQSAATQSSAAQLSATQPSAARPRRNWLYPLIALAAALVVGVAVLPGLNRGQGDFARYQSQPGAVTTAIKDRAGAVVADVVRLTDGHAYVQMRAGVPSGRAYQAWKIEGGKPVSLGLFRGQEFGAQLPAGTVFAVTVEPAGGSPQPTTPPLFAQPI